ncbi:hypothetical protein ACVWW1_009856 [Bradyrhizobium sp. JR3.5]
MTENSKTNSSIGRLNRRTLLKAAGATGLASAMNVPLANIARGAGSTIKIGWVGCLSGVRAPFAEPDTWIHERIKARLKDGLKIGGKTWQVEFVFKDNQSDPNRSSVVASELVLREKCDLILIEDGDAQAPVQELADARGIPSISTMVPWQGWMFPRKSTPDKGFPYSYHFFWGADDVVKNFLGMWQSVETNKKVGTLYIDNPAGQAFSDPKVGLPGRHYAGGLSGILRRKIPDCDRRLHQSGVVLQEQWRRHRLRLHLRQSLGDAVESGGPGRLQAADLHGGGGVPVSKCGECARRSW